jgi:hypothetical protein
MAPRPHWKGYLKLSLVSCPIALYPAIAASERISFRQVNKQTGNRLRQQLVDTVTGDVVQSSDKGRGYEFGENQFLVVKDEELEAAQHEARTRPFSTAPSRAASIEEPLSNRSEYALLYRASRGSRAGSVRGHSGRYGSQGSRRHGPRGARQPRATNHR